DLQFSDPGVKEVDAFIWYVFGRKDRVDMEYGARVDTPGRFVFELPEGPNWNDEMFMSLDLELKPEQVTEGLTVTTKICRRQDIGRTFTQRTKRTVMGIQPRAEHRQWGRIVSSEAVSATFGISSVHAAQCLNGELRAPVGYYQWPAEDDGGEYSCKRVEPHVGSLSLTSKYEGSDSARNTLNEEAYQEYIQATSSVRSFEKAVIAAT